MTEFITHSEAETHEIGRIIGGMLAPGAVVALTGTLGSGKTALVRGICRWFGCDDQLSSPTFTIINVYDGSSRVQHCDLYRLTRTAELHAAGLDDAIHSGDIVLIEWAERALGLLPEHRHEIVMEHGHDPDERIIRHHQRVAGEPSMLELFHPDLEPLQ